MSRELQTICSSGELTQMYLGGVAATDKVQKKLDMTSANISFDDTGLGITAVTAQAAIAALAEVGLLVMSGSALTPQTIGVTATKVALFDTKNVEAGVGVLGDIATDKATATLSGVFKIRFESFLSYASNVDITWQLYKNGVAYGDSITLAGQGSKVFPITLITSDNFIANDYLELYATASSSTNITIAQANGTLEKTIF